MKEKNHKIYLINMDRSASRLENMKARFKNLNLDFERITGVDSSKLTVEELYKRYSIQKSISDFYRPLHLGEIGCYISHQNAWQKIVDDDMDFGIVLEDDITIEDNFNDAINFAKENIDKWQFLRIQKEVKCKKIYNVAYSGSNFKLVEYIKSSGCTFGYMIKKESAKILLKELVPFGITADTNMHLYDKYGVNFKALIPYAVSAGIPSPSENVTFTPTKTINFSKFSRKFFSIHTYSVRIKHLIKRDGIFTFILRMLKR